MRQARERRRGPARGACTNRSLPAARRLVLRRRGPCRGSMRVARPSCVSVFVVINAKPVKHPGERAAKPSPDAEVHIRMELEEVDSRYRPGQDDQAENGLVAVVV